MGQFKIALFPVLPRTGKSALFVAEKFRLDERRRIDKTFIQSKMLNTAKGPAVHSLRAQTDKAAYHMEMKKTLENQQNLTLKQGEVVDLLVESESKRSEEHV